MRFINKKTKQAIETNSLLKGIWVTEAEFVQTEPPLDDQEETALENDRVNHKEDEHSNVPENVTKAMIMQELDALGTKYNKQANKQELYDLMLAQGN